MKIYSSCSRRDPESTILFVSIIVNGDFFSLSTLWGPDRKAPHGQLLSKHEIKRSGFFCVSLRDNNVLFNENVS